MSRSDQDILIQRKKSERVDFGERGFYNKRNKLNELTGKEWIYFTNSVWITGYSPTAIENVGLKYRKIHPSPKPPGLIKDIILFFTKSNSLILDPFVGVGGTLLGTVLAGGHRKAVGIDLSSQFKKAYQKACKAEGMKEMPYMVGDSLHLLEYKEITRNNYDLIIADPPYSDMMRRDRTGQRVKLYNHKGGTPFSKNGHDLGNMDKSQFLSNLKKIIQDATSLLKMGKYLIVFCKDFQPQNKQHNMLHAEVVTAINDIAGIEYKGMRIWHDQAMSLYPFGYPFAFVMNQIHQYILVFRKVH